MTVFSWLVCLCTLNFKISKSALYGSMMEDRWTPRAVGAKGLTKSMNTAVKCCLIIMIKTFSLNSRPLVKVRNIASKKYMCYGKKLNALLKIHSSLTYMFSLFLHNLLVLCKRNLAKIRRPPQSYF